jgi:type IV pilus assembly protein PilA
MIKKKKKKLGFTLIELLVVIAIIGILGAVALPLYKGYTIMAKLSEVENAMSTVASSVTAFYQQNDSSWPDCPSINEVGSSLGVALLAVTRIGAISVSGADGTITASIQNVHYMVDNKTLTLTPNTSSTGDGSLTWNWGWSVDFPSQFRPKSGRR